MKNIDVGQTVQIAANVGVIVGIVFLGLELEQNNQLLRNEARHSLTNNAATAQARRAENPELMHVRVKAINRQELTQEEELRLAADSLSIFANWAWEFEQYQQGLLSSMPVAGYRNLVRQYPYLADQFRAVRTNWGEDFAKFMEDEILE
jgi:hypothetical protein